MSRGDGDGGMTEQVLDDLEIGAGGEGEGGSAVAQVVQPDGWESGAGVEFPEPGADGGDGSVASVEGKIRAG